MKTRIVTTLRRRTFQSLWARLHHLSMIGMNFWAATVEESGELNALAYASRKLNDPDQIMVFDIGANVGQFAFAAIQALGARAHVHAFEPSARTFHILTDNIAAHGLGERITPHRLGLGSQDETARLYSSGAGAPIASLYPLRNPLQAFDQAFSETVEITTLDGFCALHGVARIDYLKMDIEGHELFALNGAVRLLAERRIRFVQFEFGEANIDSRTYFRDFHQLLGTDYDLYRIVPDGLQPLAGYSAELEIFATINYLAELKR